MGLLLRNWHIKLSAIALATILYTGIVFSGSFSEDTLPGVDVQPVRKPDNTYLFSDAPVAVDVDYRAARTQVTRIGRDSFQAFVDLSTYDLTRPGEPQRLAVEVTADEGIQVLDWEPRQVTVRLDELAVREVPVVVDPGQVPGGFEVGTPSIEPTRVEARGPRTRLAEVVQAVARVRIDSSGVDVRQQVTLVAVDADGEEVEPIDLDPELATVDIAVRTTETTKTVPVAYTIVGSPAAGYVLDAVTAEPAVVTIRGDPRTIRAVANVPTAPIAIDGATTASEFTAELVVPEGVRLVEATTVTVSVTISPASGSRTLTVGIVCSGAPDGGRCELSLDRLSVTVEGPVPLLNDLTAQEATPTVSVSGLAPGTYTLEPTFALPDGLEVLSVSPTTVEVAVFAAATPAPTAEATPTPTTAP
ncbi:MAG: YbbR-like domain-containing protein [Candidatus Limnocylindria bacterium]